MNAEDKEIYRLIILADCARELNQEIPGEVLSILANVEPEKLTALRKGRGRVVKPRGERVSKEVSATTISNLDQGLPPAGTLDPKQFLAAFGAAGKRFKLNEKGISIPFTAEEAVRREDEKVAVASYIGWNPKENHGTQVDAARRRAQYEISKLNEKDAEIFKYISGVLIEPYRRTVTWSAKGFVAGMPESRRKHIDDLLAREELAAITMGSYEQTAEDLESKLHSEQLTEEQTAKLKNDILRAKAFAAREGERIKEIQKVLSEDFGVKV